MASLTIRNLDDSLKQRLRVQAAAHGHSMEEEARTLLAKELTPKTGRPRNLAVAIRQAAMSVGGVKLNLPPREAERDPPDFSGF